MRFDFNLTWCLKRAWISQWRHAEISPNKQKYFSSVVYGNWYDSLTCCARASKLNQNFGVRFVSNLKFLIKSNLTRFLHQMNWNRFNRWSQRVWSLGIYSFWLFSILSIPETKDCGGINVDASSPRSRDFSPHESHRVGEGISRRSKSRTGCAGRLSQL